MKTCSRCHEVKPITEFSKNKRNADGLCVACKPCTRASSDAYYQANKDKSMEQSRKWRAANKHKKWEQHLRYYYDMSIEEYDQRLHDQNNCCAICKNVFEGNGRKKTAPCVDHCHVTGKVRNIICGRCNRLLGVANDNTILLQSAIEYLTMHVC